MITEFDMVFDKICEDVFPKLNSYIHEEHLVDEGHVDIHEIKSFLTDEEGYDTDMTHRIWDSYQISNHFKKLLHRETDTLPLSHTRENKVSV
tara:strand:- start:2341 stop:2616 length:276 start_codon:yes stop_codon:yes gene_type:complete